MKSTNVYMKLSGIIFIVLSAAFATSLQGQITQVGTATIASSVDWGSTTLTINKPSGISVGDIMIANISQTTDWQITPTVPAGTPTSDNWTQIATNNSGYNNIARGTLLYKIANATDADPATISYTFTLGANHKAAGAIVAFTGINKDNPFIAKDIGLMQLTPLSNNITCPGITTSADNAMVIMFATDWALCGTRDFNSWATAINPNPLTENYDYNSDVIPYVHIGAAWALKENAGPTGTGTLSNTNCSDIASRKTTAILLALRPERAVSITGPASICAANGTTTLIPTSGGTWESSNPSVASVTNAGDVTGLAAGTASFTFTADGGAWSATTEAVTVNPSFTPAVTIVSDLPGNKKCETQQYLLVKFTANTSNTGGGTVYYQWYWKGIPLSDWDISNTWESSELDDGEKVSCMIKVTGACLTSPTATSNEITTRVYPDVLPTVRIESDPGNEICDGANVIFTAIPENTNGGEVSYLWYLNGDPIGSYDKKTYYNNGESGNGDVVSCTITVTNGACFGTATATSDEITITVNPDGGTAATTTPTICPGKTAVITLTDYLGTIQWQYFNGTDIVDVVGGTGSTSSVYTTPPLNEDTYFFAKVTGGTCPPTSSNEVLITVNPAPENKSVTAKETQLCPGSITNVILQSSQTGVTYQLRNDNGDINIGDPVLGTGNDLELETGALNTTTTFNVFATSGDCSLEMADTPTVTVLDNTPASITDVTANLPAICNGSTSTLTVTGWLGGATAWNWFSGSCGGTLAGTGTSITVSPTETTIYYVRGEGGCATPGGTCSEVTVTVNPSPTLTSVSTPSWDVCVGSPIDVTASGLLNGTTQFEYAVTFVDSDDLTDDIITEVSVTKEVSGGEATFSIAVPAVGSYYIFVTSVTINGCTTTNFTYPENYTWFLADPLPSVSISGETSVCSGSETVLEALTSGGVGFSKIRWEYEKEKDIWEFISESEDYVTITVSPTETTTYRAIYSRDGNGCGSAISDDFTITVNGLPTVNIASSAPDNKTCEGTMVTFTATPVNTGGMKVSYSWSYNGISIGSDQDFYTSDELIDGDMVWCTITVNNEACSTETRPISNKIVMSVESTPIAGTLAKTPDVMTVGAGTDVSAVLIPGSGGDGTDMLVFRTNVGTNWSEFAPYTSGANIGTTGRTAVEIRTRRWSNYCSPSSENIVSWTVEANPVLDNPGPQTACGSYTLPTITGTNLEDAKYYDNSQALGGTVITGPIKSSMMVWIYDVTVNGYSDEESFRVTINSLPVPPAVGTITQPTCSVSTGSVVLSGLPSGSWTVTGTSGSGNVTKTGSRSTTTITGLSAGTTYTFTVTIASGCTSLPSGNVVIIPQPQAPDAPVVESQSFCGSATEADLPQRNGSNTYKWYSTSTSRSSLSGSTRLSTGIYYVSQVSGGCESSRTGVNITINDLPASFRVTGGGTCCGGGPGLTVKLSGSTTGVDYQLCLNGSPVAGEIVSGTGSAISFTDQTLAGTYTVIAIKVSTGCQATMTGRAVISVSNPPAATSIVYSKSSSSNCSTSGSATVSYFSGTSGGRYSSSPSGLSINSSTGTVNFARSNPGIYTVTYSVHNTCGTAETTTQIRVTRCTKSGYISNDQGASPDLTIATSELKVYPNPSNGPVRFEFSTILDGRVTLDIINMQGQLIMRLFEGDAVAGEVRTVLFDGYLTAGTYIYRMTSADGVKNGKIIRM